MVGALTFREIGPADIDEAATLSVPVGQERARRFYTREGFIAVGEPFDFAGLPALEYQRPL